MVFQRPYRRDVLLIALAALVVRIAAIPWARTVQADAVSRIHIAYEWLLDPYYIKEGYWGPLHHYLNALFMLVLPGKTAGPLALNILCAVLTVIPLYGFALNLFGSRKGAVFTSLLYVFSPIVLWTSMQALSEVSYGFFLACAIYALSEAPREQRGYRTAIVGGLLITCAAALRYEAWVIIATLTLVVFLLRSWRYTLVFWLCAMVFPGTWMIGNQLAFGDFLYSVNQNDVWNMLKEGINDEVLPKDRLMRALFFPWSFMLNVSPVVMVLLAVSLVGAMVRRTLTRDQWVWLIPAVVMVAVFQRKAWEGSLMMQHRFLVTWLVLLLPFVALVFQGVRWPRSRMALMVLGFVSVIPLTFAWNKVDYIRIFGDNLFGKAMDDLVMAYYRELEVIPRLPGPETDELLALINTQSVTGGGLVLDFHGWDRTYYLLLHAHANTVVVGGAKYEAYDPEELAELFRAHPHGQIVFSRTGMLKDRATLRGELMELEDTGMPLIVGPPEVLRGLRLFNYRLAADDAPERLAAQDLDPVRVFPEGKDAEYFDQQIRTDEQWYYRVRRQAYQESVPVDTMVRRNVDYLLDMEAAQ
jgi:hypothetical protein